MAVWSVAVGRDRQGPARCWLTGRDAGQPAGPGGVGERSGRGVGVGVAHRHGLGHAGRADDHRRAVDLRGGGAKHAVGPGDFKTGHLRRGHPVEVDLRVLVAVHQQLRVEQQAVLVHVADAQPDLLELAARSLHRLVQALLFVANLLARHVAARHVHVPLLEHAHTADSDTGRGGDAAQHLALDGHQAGSPKRSAINAPIASFSLSRGAASIERKPSRRAYSRPAANSSPAARRS